ncbi:MAG: radical SAM family heme chaperone HemW, partial [Actinomycetota bacterium]
VPFCAHRCWYCDFNAYAGLDHLADAYMDAVIRDVTEGLSAPDGAGLDARPAVTSIFIGGGTPSLVDARHIVRVLDAIRASWTVEPRAEVTIECNPESVDRARLESYLAAGVNRISFGVQSLDDELLARLGRTHDAGMAVNALRMARSAGFDDVSADLIFGIPDESHEAWLASLEGVLACAPTHVSCYGLTYEEGTPLAAWKRLGKVVAVPDDDVAARWDAAEVMLTSAGLKRYEISNWSRPGRRCCHNDLYWRCGEYIGVGAGAHGHLASSTGSLRSWTVKAPERYIRMIEEGISPVAGAEEIDARTRAAEVMLLGLRRSEGVDAGTFAALVGASIQDVFAEELAHGLQRGLISWDGGRVGVVRPMLGDEACRLFA